MKINFQGSIVLNELIMNVRSVTLHNGGFLVSARLIADKEITFEDKPYQYCLFSSDGQQVCRGSLNLGGGRLELKPDDVLDYNLHLTAAGKIGSSLSVSPW